jgi:hypothetical protein
MYVKDVTGSGPEILLPLIDERGHQPNNWSSDGRFILYSLWTQGPAMEPLRLLVLDSLELSPAYVKTSTWDIIAWNRAASAVLADYEALAAEQRNGLRLVFCNPRVRAAMTNWESDARFVVAAFRADTARAGMAGNVKALVDELCRLSPEFEAMWRDNDVRST